MIDRLIEIHILIGFCGPIYDWLKFNRSLSDIDPLFVFNRLMWLLIWELIVIGVAITVWKGYVSIDEIFEKEAQE